MKDPIVKPSPPAAVTITVYLLFAAGIFEIVNSFTGVDAAYGRFYPAAQVLLIILIFAALSGILSMEKWGAWLFLAALTARLLLEFGFGAKHPASLLLLLPGAIFIRYLLVPRKV